MNTHQRNVPATIDPTKLERLAEDGGQGRIAAASPGRTSSSPRRSPRCLWRVWIAERGLQGLAPGLVTPIFSDEEMTLARFRFAPDASFDRAPRLALRGRRQGFRRQYGAARHRRRRSDAARRARIAAKVARANKANSIAYQPALEKIAGFDINWNIVAYPTLSWAKRVFPGEEDDVAVGKLAEAIFAASRVDDDDPVAAWAAAQRRPRPPEGLAERQEVSRAALFRAGHGSHHRARRRPRMAGRRREGEERRRVQSEHPDRGSVHDAACAPGSRAMWSARKLLSYQGSLIDGLAVRFEAGRIVEAKAAQGEDVLRKVLADRRGRGTRLGEVAVSASHSSPISKSGPMFFNTPVRRERRLPHRRRAMLFPMLRRRRQAHPQRDRGARRQQEHDPYRLDDRLGRHRHRRPRRRRPAARPSSAGASGPTRPSTSRSCLAGRQSEP